MEINTTLSNSIEAADKRASYDAACKQILAEKIILAWIMKHTMKEFKDVPVQVIADKYIIDTPEVGKIPVLPDTDVANKISLLSDVDAASRVQMPQDTGAASKVVGTGVEDTTISEGTVTFDIRFRALIPNTEEIVGLIINIEAQNDFYPGYPLIKRSIYYCSRMISSQYGTVFTKSHYEKISKVYSVWICLNPPENRKNTITSYDLTEKNIVGSVKENAVNYDLMSAIMICLGNSENSQTEDRDSEDLQAGDSAGNSLLRLLDVLLLKETDSQTKKRILEEDFDIPMTEHFVRRMDEMCNLSKGVYERGIEQGIEQGILTSLKNLMTNLKIPAEDAIKALGIAPEDSDKYLSMLSRKEV